MTNQVTVDEIYKVTQWMLKMRAEIQPDIFGDDDRLCEAVQKALHVQMRAEPIVPTQVVQWSIDECNAALNKTMLENDGLSSRFSFSPRAIETFIIALCQMKGETKITNLCKTCGRGGRSFWAYGVCPYCGEEG